MAKAISPDVEVHTNRGSAAAAATHGGPKNQKPEAHYQKLVDRSVNNAPEQERYSAKGRRK